MNNNLISHQECYKKITQAKKLVFFCGSAISSFMPSNIISGRGIKNSLLQYFKDLQRQFRLYGIDIEKFFNLPLETIIDIGTYVMKGKPNIRTLNSLKKYLKDTAPNKLHFYIASYLYFHRYVSVITTNYDDGIENAYDLLSKVLGPPKNSLHIYTVENLCQIQNPQYPSIYKIHGCAKKDKASNLVFTTRQESNIFNNRTLNLFQKIFNNSLTVFLGYSFSEPDCFEALFDEKNFEVIWFCKKIDDLINNKRVLFLLKNAKKYSIVEDLGIINNQNLDTLTQFTRIKKNKNGILDEIEKKIINSTMERRNIEKDKRGEYLFRQLFTFINKEKFIKGLISGFLQIRDFELTNKLLLTYEKIKTKDNYFCQFSKASIVRDLNSDWKPAFDLFRKAQMITKLSLENVYSAKVEELGLKTLLNQNSNDKLIETENELKILINEIEITSSMKKYGITPYNYAVLGRAQKNLVQNLCYQKNFSTDRFKEANILINQAIENLNFSREIHPRIESERFKGRLFFKEYVNTLNKHDLKIAIYWTRKSLFLFSLLEGQMGRINATRQYIYYLLKYGDYVEAKEQLSNLLQETEISKDKLSYQKTLLLQLILLTKTRKYFESGKLIIKLIAQFVYIPWFMQEKPPMNIYETLIWFRKYLKGTAG